MNTVFITGVSSGLGYALAEAYLKRDWHVYGLSRRTPEDLLRPQAFQHGAFHHAVLDLRDHDKTPGVIAELLRGLDHLDLAILNAGTISRIEDLANVGLDEMKDVMDVNVWANKTLIDAIFSEIGSVDQIVTISSGASVNGYRGWSGYSVSKAALNMLTMLYARERPDTHFCALAPGVIDTPIQEDIRKLPHDPRFPAIENIRRKQGTPDMLSPEDGAERLIGAIERLPGWVESGTYADVRKLPE